MPQFQMPYFVPYIQPTYQQPIDYDKLAEMVADKLKTKTEQQPE